MRLSVQFQRRGGILRAHPELEREIREQLLGRVREDAVKDDLSRSGDEMSDTASAVTELYSFPHRSTVPGNISPLWETLDSMLGGHWPDSYSDGGSSGEANG